jgi:hypothetical protein
MGSAELPDLGDEERQHDPYRRDRGSESGYAVYFICHTNLVGTFRELYAGELSFDGNRGILLDARTPVPAKELGHCVAMALTYQSARRARKK